MQQQLGARQRLGLELQRLLKAAGLRIECEALAPRREALIPHPDHLRP
jgi:hypothetical protein